ncbi:cell wall-binding repeat-containing protein [Kineococcus sp. G2]|uniref:cell wall-binding repeat-containing protein n=1 Tax=Kineococcus sp. G2 TaxID=3127484 RepID=UPI00301D6040
MAGAGTLLMSVVLGAASPPSAAAAAAPTTIASAAVTVTRLAGADRYATAAAIARATFPPGPYFTADVVVARGDAFPDALSAVNLTGRRYGGPASLLLTERDRLPADSAAVVDASHYVHGFIVGAAGVVGDAVADRVAAAQEHPGVIRVGGADRYETNAAAYRIAYDEEADIPASVDGQRTALLVSGTSYADAISAGPVASEERLPLLLSEPTTLSGTVEDILTTRGRGITQVVVVGGPQAVSEQVVAQLEAMGLTVRRVAGADRQATSVAMFDFAAQEFGWTPQHVTLARGDAFADAVAGATRAGRRHAPMLLTTGPDDLGGAARAFLNTHAGEVSTLEVLGDQSAVSDAVVADAVNAVTR